MLLTINVYFTGNDAVKVLTDLYCSAKLNPMPHLASAFELACAIKDRSILDVLMNGAQKFKHHFIELHKEVIFRTLEGLFSVLTCTSCASRASFRL